MALNKKWIKVFLACQAEMGYQIAIKGNLIRNLVSFSHNAMYIEDCESIIERIITLMKARRLLIKLRKDIKGAIATLDITKRQILYLRHKESLDYLEIATRLGLKLRSVFYQYNKAVECILKRFIQQGYTDKELISALEGDPLILDGFCKNELRERRTNSVRCCT